MVRATADSVFVAFRDTVAAVAPRQAVAAGACSTLRVWADPGVVGADFVGIPGAAGTLSPDKKPQVTGVFTELKVPADGLSARIDIDTRFITQPTILKLAVMASRGVVRARPSIAALCVRPARHAPPVTWPTGRPARAHWPSDAGVIGTLLLRHVIGPISSDDGYNLTIARISGEAGYAANYYRYFGASEAPSTGTVGAGPAGRRSVPPGCGCGCPPPPRRSGAG